MNHEITNVITGSVLFSCEASSWREAILKAVKVRANLYGADLCGANLCGADLCGANLCGADLGGANLRGADLCGADLCGANLYGANLYGANLRGANLRGANLYGADLCGADLCGADLCGADLCGANLCGANLYGADLCGAKNTELALAQTFVCPQEGAFVGWKKLRGNVIAKLVIPHDALRTNAIGSRKCRASKVFVHELFGGPRAYDKHSGATLYEVGKEVFPDSYDGDRRVECTNGIHFFITREEAEAY